MDRWDPQILTSIGRIGLDYYFHIRLILYSLNYKYATVNHFTIFKITATGPSESLWFWRMHWFQNGNISELLLQEGFARCADWSMKNVSNGADKLRAAEKWEFLKSNFVPLIALPFSFSCALSLRNWFLEFLLSLFVSSPFAILISLPLYPCYQYCWIDNEFLLIHCVSFYLCEIFYPQWSCFPVIWVFG